MAGEQLLVLRDVGLGDHILNGRGDFGRGHSVDTAEGETKDAVTDTLLKLVRDGIGKFDRLLFNRESADDNSVFTNGARGRGKVAVGDHPCGAI